LEKIQSIVKEKNQPDKNEIFSTNLTPSEWNNIKRNYNQKRKYGFIVLGIIFILVFGSMFAVSHYSSDLDFMEAFIIFYGVLSFGYILYKYLFAWIYSAAHLHKSRIHYEPSISIVIPCYNEMPEDLEKCIVSACDNSYPHKEIIVVDDGSKNKESWATIERLQQKYGFKKIKFDQNKGKREAMYAGFKAATGEIIVTMDSDSIIVSGESISELVKPLKDKSVGAVSGNIQVLNYKENVMSRMQWARYWLAFHIEKASQSPYDGVTCCSGPFSAYRREYLMQYLDEWINQNFLGIKCTYGDDRGLTTMMSRNGFKVQYAKYALCLTNVPSTISKFTKQQIRWKKSFIRENYYLSKFILNKNVFMQIEFFWFWVIFIIGFMAKALVILFLFTGRTHILSFILMITFVALLHELYAFIRNPGKMGFYGVFYGFLNEFWISWLFWYSLSTLKETKWGTR